MPRYVKGSSLFALAVLAVGCRQESRGSPDTTQATDSSPTHSSQQPVVSETMGPYGEWAINGHPQFAGRFSIKGFRLLLALDTMGDGPAHRWIPVDSVMAEVAKNETFSMQCGRDPSAYAGDLVGIVFDSDTTSVQVPRLAWLLDLGENKVRSVKPDSIRCLFEGPVD